MASESPIGGTFTAVSFRAVRNSYCPIPLGIAEITLEKVPKYMDARALEVGPRSAT